MTMSKRKTTISQVRTLCDSLCNTKTLGEAADLLSTSRIQLVLTGENPLYYHFSIPKSSGQLRHIEAPSEDLKKVQRRLNEYLQAYYFLHQHSSAHGYIQRVYGSKIRKSILTNAEAHIHNEYLVNMDFSDFFHLIKSKDIFDILRSTSFRMDKQTAHTIAKVCTYKGRLPMGAPTSPVLSNIYCLQLDAELSDWASKKGITYTRYVDDMSFSSAAPIAETDIAEIEAIVTKHGLVVNPSKTKVYGKDSLKVVTGLVLNETVDLPTAYYDHLAADIRRLASIIEVQYITGIADSQNMVRAYKKEIAGKINFIAMIEGKDSVEHITKLDDFHAALSPPEQLSLRWTQFSNYW